MEYLLKDALFKEHDHVWLKQNGEALGIDETEDDEKLAAEIAAKMLEPEDLMSRMLVLNDNDISFFEYVVKNQPVHPSRANYRSADRLRHMDLAFIADAKRNLIIPDDIIETYRLIDTKEFHEKRKKVSWLYDCVSLIPNFYGFLSIHDLCDMYRKKKGMADDNTAIVMELLPYVIHQPDCLCIREGNEIVTVGLNDAGNEAKLRELHKAIPVSIPSYGEIKDILDHRYPSRNKAYAAVFRWFIRELKQDEYYAEALTEAVFRYIGYGNTFSDIMDMLENEKIAVTDAQREQMKTLLADAWDTTRMLMCNGSRPCDVMPGNRQVFLSEE